jgi:hypothetical protein
MERENSLREEGSRDRVVREGEREEREKTKTHAL